MEGLALEMFEEVGITVKKSSLLRSVEKEYVRNGILVNVTCKIFNIDEYQGEAFNKEFDKHSELKWLSVDEIKNLGALSDALIWYLEYLQ